MHTRAGRILSWVAVGVALVLARGVGAQGIPYSGQDVAPVFEGWRTNADGSYTFYFGYFNRNQEQQLDVPVGLDNMFQPGNPDQGQPTHFYPRRNRFVFTVQLPKDFGKEIVWTLTTNGKKNTAYGTLHPDYYTDDIVIMNDQGAGGSGGGGNNINDNKPPTLAVDGPTTRTVTVGHPLQLAAVAHDDGVPKRRVVPLTVPWTEDARRIARIGSRCCADSASGLRLSFFVYRGPAAQVTFDPPQFEQWEDYRDARNSPWSAGWEVPPIPADNKWTTRATFKQPGTYVVRALAHDGGLMIWEDITVVVQ
jgi:hypothetical protein